MLPLSNPTKTVLSALSDSGVSEDSLTAALSLDLAPDGKFGSVWLLLSIPNRMLYRVTEGSEKIEQWSLDCLHSPYIDNYDASCRLLVRRTNDPVPVDADESAREAVLATAYTFPLGGCTNACKSRLAAFLQIWERSLRGEEITAEDPLFQQFNTKSPKCGSLLPYLPVW